MSQIDLLVAVRREEAARYYKNLSTHSDFNLQVVTESAEALEILADKDQHIDVLVLDNGLTAAYAMIEELRHTYPRLLIILVDEEADFALPGQADEISTNPFTNNDLSRRITRLMSDRQLETLRADAMPSVRAFASKLRGAPGETGKQQAAVSACKELGFDYVAFYRIESLDPLSVPLRAQDGPTALHSAAPKQAAIDDIMGWVARSGQSRTAGESDALNHPFVAKGRFGAVACVPVGTATRYGVLVACREAADSISQQHVLMLELVSAQLAAAVSKDAIG
jgi:hypothetical protein